MEILKNLIEHSNYAFFCIIALVLSLIFTKACIIFLPKMGFVDKPGGRHIHKQAVPRGGGIAIILAFNLVFLATALIMKVPGMLKVELTLFISSLPLICLNIADDRRELGSKFKLCFQILVAVLAWYFISPQCSFYGWKLPPIATFVLCIPWIILVMNAYNLVDGLDGLASGLSMISAFGFAAYFLICGGNNIHVYSMYLLIASILGFYRYNFHPAKIFLGDTGSTYLGFIMAIQGIRVMDGHNLVCSSFFIPILLVGIPLIDVAFAIWRRSVRKVINPNASGIMEGDRDHLHHRLLRQLDSQILAVGALYLFDLSMIVTAIIFQLFCARNGAIAAAVMLILILIIIRQLGVIELADTSKIVQQDWMRKRLVFLSNIVHPVIDTFEIVLSYFIAVYLVFNANVSWILFISFIFPIAILMGALHIYRINWLRGGIQNYAKLVGTLIFGTILSCSAGAVYFYAGKPDNVAIPSQRVYLTFCILFFSLNIIQIFFERFLLHYSESFWMRNLYLKSLDSGSQRVLVYGGGLQCKLLVTYLYSSMHKSVTDRIIGVIDDDKALKNMSAFGFPVLGTSTDVAKIYAEKPFDKIIMTISEENCEREKMLMDFCMRHGIEMERMTLEFTSCLDEDEINHTKTSRKLNF